DCVGRNIPGHDRACTHNGTVSDSHSVHDEGALPDPDIVGNHDVRVIRKESRIDESQRSARLSRIESRMRGNESASRMKPQPDSAIRPYGTVLANCYVLNPRAIRDVCEITQGDVLQHHSMMDRVVPAKLHVPAERKQADLQSLRSESDAK